MYCKHCPAGLCRGYGYLDLHCIVEDDSRRRGSAKTNPFHKALRYLKALVELKSEEGILDRHFLQLKSHVINDHGRVGDCSLEGFRMTLQVKRMGALAKRGVNITCRTIIQGGSRSTT